MTLNTLYFGRRVAVVTLTLVLATLAVVVTLAVRTRNPEPISAVDTPDTTANPFERGPSSVAVTAPRVADTGPPSSPSGMSPTTVARSCTTSNPPLPGECTIVDWDLVGSAESVLTLEVYVNAPGCAEEIDRIDVVETNTDVTITAVAKYIGTAGGTCPTALGSTLATVELRASLGSRALLGCRQDDSFAPAGGYDSPEPRSSSQNCL